MSERRLRDAVRAVVLDPEDRILLVRFEFPDRAVWATPGGGLDPGETDEAAIRRELVEEAGLDGFELGPLIWKRTHVFEARVLGNWDGQRERYFLVRAPAFEPAPGLTWPELNAEFVTAIRWWTLDELNASEELFAPRLLPSLVRALVDGDSPGEPFDVGV